MNEDKTAQTPVLRDPRTCAESDGKSEISWQDQVRMAREARRQGARLREGKPRSFRPVVGRI
ncbi:Uncharacterised protein [Propionibacterium australiense]|uniref:Uncharacterized protein n=1 Tax=Propionibacterium australiense TaxID=119981 RepID=A0A383S590_9ACTN|nr:hypothetical protein D7U36_11695 [Propionibacterium australiense]RLP07074.1 hypothetical protein D9T14_10715 [Propionibacterium australiense]SYZ33155.1 Hypothetical protein PROPAUS_1071 [Propionibacterium australiense]VEH89171.1 Uncharacterised protein [Propionibacterium australiense]